MRIASVVLLAATLGCSNVPKGSYGQVFDLETKKPIAGAEITVHRTGKHRTPIGGESKWSGPDGAFSIEKVKGEKISHVVASAGGYYPGVATRRGRIYLRPVPAGALPARSVEYEVELESEDVGLRISDGAIVPAEEADLVVTVYPEKRPWNRTVTVRGNGGVRRIVSRMPQGVGVEPEIAFDNIVEVPKGGYTKRRSRGTWEYGWGAYGTYAVRTPERDRYAKAYVAGFLKEGGDRARVVIRYRTSNPDNPRFVATTP